MKKFYYLISMLAVLSLGACQNEDDLVSQVQKLSEVEVEATLENGANSRTYLSSEKIYWENNDALTVFLGNTTGQKATIIEDSMDDTYAQFKITAGSDVILGGGTEDDETTFANVAYYPYGENVTVTKEGENYVVSAVFPAEQNFKDGSFDTNVYPMVAVTDGLNFGFKNVAGMIHIPLKGTATIIKVEVTSKSHKLAGNYKVTASADAVPTMEMADDAVNLITLNCGEGVSLDENTAKGFDFVLPVGAYEGGDLTFKFYDDNNGYMEFVAANDDKVERSKRTVFSEKIYRSDLGYEKVGENEYNVWSAKGLLQFSDVQQKGVTLNIIDDIDFEDAEFKAIPASGTLTINGNNYTISNVKVVSGTNDNGTGQASMFYAYTGSTLNVSDLKIDNIQVTGDENGSGYVAAVVGYAEGAVTMDNVDVTNAAITGAKSSGMLVGHLAANGSLIAKNCDVSGTITLTDYESGGHYAGEYIGSVCASAELTTCTANVTITGNLKDTNVGTIYGRIVSGGSLTINGAIVVGNADDLYELAQTATGDVKIMLVNNITLGNETERCMAVDFKNVTKLTIEGNDKTLTLKGKDASSSGSVGDGYVAGILATGADVTIQNLTIVNDKLSCKGTETSAGRNTVYTFVRGVTVTYDNVTFDGGVQVKGNETFKECNFTETVLTKNADGYATDGRFCMFIDHQYDATGTFEVTLENCIFNASGYGCVKVAGDKGAYITVNVKSCSFTNTCPSNNWSKDTPKYDIKKTGTNITVNDQGGNAWSTGSNTGIGEG